LEVKVQKLADDLFLILLTPSITGFCDFISAWLYRGKITCLIDVGPSSTAPDLLRALQELNIDQLPPDIQERERYFLQNSISGYLGWLESEDR
jgi:hypothetical protein